MTRSITLGKAMVVALWVVQPLSAQVVPASAPGLGAPLDSRLVELTKGRLLRFDYDGNIGVQGELLAVDDRSMWLLANGQTRSISLDGVRRIQVRQHGFGGKKVWTWIGIGAAVTGLGMAAACSSIDDLSGCGSVFPLVALSWGIVGGLFSVDVIRGSWAEVSPVRSDLLRYSRFPQGLPEGYGR